MTKHLFAVVGSMAVAFGALAPAHADPVLDGSGFGTPTATIAYDSTAPVSNFGAPGATTSGASYTISTKSDATYAYYLLSQTGDGTAAGVFANLYFGTGSSASATSDLGFEVNNSDAFVPGVPGNVSTLGTGITFADLNGGNQIEFAIPFSYLETDPQNLGFTPLTAANPDLVLRLSQSFGYSVAGGASFGADRLGTIVAPFAAAAPEPASWAMMILGFGIVGGALRSRSRKSKDGVANEGLIGAA